MSETVAIALISALPATAVALAALGANLLTESRRRRHEREMRLLEGKRADRVDRLAPVRGFLDGVSREALAYYNTPHQRSIEQLATVLREQAYVCARTSDERLGGLLKQVVEAAVYLVEAWRAEQDEEASRLTDRLEAAVKSAWDRLEELQSEL